MLHFIFLFVALDILFDVLIAIFVCFSSFFFLLHFRCPLMFAIAFFHVAVRGQTMVVIWWLDQMLGWHGWGRTNPCT